MNSCPCNECMCIPICRYKSWTNLMVNCSLIYKYSITFNNGLPFYYRIIIRNILKPTQWGVDDDGYFNYKMFPPIRK